MSLARRFVALAAPCVAAAALLAGSALAYVCHPDSVGTRTLTLHASVLRVSPHGSTIDLLVSSHGSCSRVIWNTAAGLSDSIQAACTSKPRSMSSGRAILPALSASSNGQRISVTRGWLQQPDVLTIRDSRGKLVRALPLPARPQTLSVSDGLAVFSAKGQGVFAIRLSDGLFSFLGPDGGAFQPQLSSRGVVFHDGESKLALRHGETIVKFLPRSAILQSIERTARPLVTGGPIRSVSMDGPRVAVAVGDTRGLCDRVLYWNIAWYPAQRVSAPAGPTCQLRPSGVEISSVAIGGFRAEWLVSQPGSARLVAGSPLCQEWVLGRFSSPNAVTALTGDGGTLAFATTVNRRSSVSTVNAKYRPQQIATGAGVPRLASDRARVAILWPDGSVDVRARGGALVASIRTGAAQAVALQGNMLAVLRHGSLEIYNVRAGTLVHRWPVPAGATGVDLQYGVAAFTQGRSALVLDTRTGRTAVVGHGLAPLVGVQIEAPGLAYAWTTGAKGVAQFVTTRQIDLALGRALA